MARGKAERELLAPPADVWAFLAEPHHLPDWWPGRQGPFVYLTLGTVTGRFEMVRAAYRALLDGVAALPIRALNEALIEELRRLDPDEVFEEVLTRGLGHVTNRTAA